MTLEYEIKYEPVTINSVVYPKYNIYYYEDNVQVDNQFHSTDGINGRIKSGYTNRLGAKWAAMYLALLANTTLINRMINTTTMSSWLSSLYAILQLGVSGYPNENYLSYVLNQPGWLWTTTEKSQFNSYFTTNQFNITVI